MRIGARVGDFEVTGVIHRGDAGFVYLAADRTSLTKIAVKEYLPTRLADRMTDGFIGVRSLRHQTPFRDGMQGFLRQARILTELDEPALVRTLRTWQQHNTAYMAMPFYEGRSLEKVFRDSPRPSEPWLKTMLGPLLDAVATLHQAHCYPCDVTPHNVVVSDGGPLIFDVGIVRRILGPTSRGRIAVLDHGYAAVEQYSVDPSMQEGPWTDVYAVASILHLAITGNPPPSPVTRIDSDAMPPLSKMGDGYSRSFLDGVDRGLAVRPRDRPQSIAEFREALGIRSLESAAIVIRTDQPTPWPPPAAPVQAVADEHSARQSNEQGPSLQTTTKGRLRVSSRIVGASLVVVVLAAVGLRWIFSSPERLPQAEHGAALINAVSAGEQSIPDTAAPRFDAPTNLPPATTLAAIASNPSAPAVERTHPTSVSTASAPQNTSAPKTGKIQFAIKPWGEIVVDGRKRGVSPPIKELSLPEGRHRIEIRNSAFSGYAGEVDVKAGRSVNIAHSFTSQ